MKTLKILAATAVLALFAGHASADEATKEALVAKEKTAWDAWAANDAAAYAGAMAADAVLVNDADIVRGSEEIATYDIDDSCTGKTYEIFETELVELGSGAAAIIYDAAYTQTCDEVEREVTARLTSTYVKDGDAWVNKMFNEILLSVVDYGDEDELEDEDGAGDDEPAEDDEPAKKKK